MAETPATPATSATPSKGYGAVYPYYPAARPDDTREISLVSQTNPDKMLQEISYRLKGYLYNPEDKKWILPHGMQEQLNNLGLNSVMTDIAGVVNQNTIMSNLNEEDISAIIINLGDTLRVKLAMNWKEYHIDKSTLTSILMLACNMAYASLMRGYREGERRFLRTSVRAVESYQLHSRPPSENSGNNFIDKLKFWN